MHIYIYIYIHTYEELFFQNAITAIYKTGLAVPMPNSYIVFWKRAVSICVYIYEEFFS